MNPSIRTTPYTRKDGINEGISSKTAPLAWFYSIRQTTTVALGKGQDKDCSTTETRNENLPGYSSLQRRLCYLEHEPITVSS